MCEGGNKFTVDKITDTIYTIVISSHLLLPGVQRTTYVCSLCRRRFDISPLCRCMGTRLSSSHFCLKVRTLKKSLGFPFPVCNSWKKERGKQNAASAGVHSVKMSRLFKSLLSIAISCPACQRHLHLIFSLSWHCTVCSIFDGLGNKAPITKTWAKMHSSEASQNPRPPGKSSSPVNTKDDEQQKFRLQTVAVSIFKVLKGIYKPLRPVETTLSPFQRYETESQRGEVSTH